jgi:hypothetical protein
MTVISLHHLHRHLAWASRRKDGFDAAAAHLPFAEDEEERHELTSPTASGTLHRRADIAGHIRLRRAAVVTQSRTRSRSASAADNTTGHVWDEDLTELNNPMPRWWMWLFYITIVFASATWRCIPGLGSLCKGKLGWASRGEYEAEVAKAERRLRPAVREVPAQA